MVREKCLALGGNLTLVIQLIAQSLQQVIPAACIQYDFLGFPATQYQPVFGGI
jgi:hypothetical protein